MARRSSEPDFIEALARGLDVLRAFEPRQPVLSLSDVAARTDLARPTARRILLTLSELGYVRGYRGRERIRMGHAMKHQFERWLHCLIRR